jgi:hypothetical protein
MRRENVIFVIIFLNVQLLVLAIKFKIALQSGPSVLGCTKKIVSVRLPLQSANPPH